MYVWFSFEKIFSTDYGFWILLWHNIGIPIDTQTFFLPLVVNLFSQIWSYVFHMYLICMHHFNLHKQKDTEHNIKLHLTCQWQPTKLIITIFSVQLFYSKRHRHHCANISTVQTSEYIIEQSQLYKTFFPFLLRVRAGEKSVGTEKAFIIA